ncbi:Zn(2)-C7 fungal-type transcription factor [Pseudohyphozyma bogoriensis]|nr:Zn(2)-C7 fungal-type transcription factor [Pseudohyphozyma bogoriensis]
MHDTFITSLVDEFLSGPAALLSADTHATFRAPSREAVVALLMFENLVECLDEEGYELSGTFGIRPILNAYVGHFRELLQIEDGLDHFISLTVMGRDFTISAASRRTQLVSNEDVETARSSDTFPYRVKSQDAVFSASLTPITPIATFNASYNSFLCHILDAMRFAAQTFRTDYAKDAPLQEAAFNTYLGSVALALTEFTDVVNVAGLAHVLHVSELRRHLRTLSGWVCFQAFLAYRDIQERIAKRWTPRSRGREDPNDEEYWTRVGALNLKAEAVALQAANRVVDLLRVSGTPLSPQGELIGSIEYIEWGVQSLMFEAFPTWATLFCNLPTTEHGGPPSFSFDVKIEAMETLLNALRSFQLFQARPRWSAYATWLVQQLEIVKRQRDAAFQNTPMEAYELVRPQDPELDTWSVVAFNSPEEEGPRGT